MKHSEQPISKETIDDLAATPLVVIARRIAQLEADTIGLAFDDVESTKQLASARAIMEKFVDKVDTGRARSKETYTEMKEWMEEQ